MKRLRLALIAMSLLAGGLRAEDDDKAKLFNTYYLDGERPTYVLVLRENRTFDLYGPDNDKISGSVRASTEHITLTAGEVKRYFHFDNKNKDLKLGMRENDKVIKGNLLGEMPPTSDTLLRTLYVAEENWKKKGRATRNLGSATPASTVTPPRVEQSSVPPPVTTPVAPASTPALTSGEGFQDISGVFYLPSPKGVNEQLTITSDGRFEYQQADGVKDKGTLMRVGDDLTLMGSAHKRQLTARTVKAGLELTRRQTDLVKPNDVLGRMPPQERDPVVWMKSPTQLAPLPVTPPEPVATTPVKAPAVETPAAPPTPPQPVKPVATVPAETPKPAGATVNAISQVTGTFVHKPNPFISETLTITDAGGFSYKDSNGAGVDGKVKFADDVMVFTSGEVVRKFIATLDGSSLTLTCAKDDSPSFKNDLATMSPTVLKVAKYEKK